MYRKAFALTPARLGRLLSLFLLAVATGGLPGCDERDLTGTDLTSSSEQAPVVAAPSVAADASATSTPTASATIGTLPLPMYQSVTSLEPAFSITQKGNAQVGYFKLDNPTALSTALRGETNASGYAVQGIAYGKAVGGYFGAHNSASGSDALQGYTSGTGNAVHGTASGTGGHAALFENTLYNNANSVLAVRTMGKGWAGVFLAPQGGKGVYISTNGGPGLQVVGGSKNAVVGTPSGAKALYTEEST